MIGQLANIAGLQFEALKPTEITVTGKPLPAVNSLVEISVLGKSGSTYRLLIDGNVFQSKLPLNLSTGELLLAKVMSTSPFTLSIDNLIAAKNLSAGLLTQMLMKLHVKETETSVRLLKNFAGMKKPVVKSRFDRLLEALGSAEINLDEQQLNFLVQVMNCSEKSYDYLDESFVKLFEYPTGDLSAIIYNSVRNLINSEAPLELKSMIDKDLVLHLSEDNQLNATDIKNKAGLSSELLEKLEQFAKDSGAPESLKAEVSRLKAALVKYELMRANREKLGSFPEFLIVEDSGDFSLLEYNINKARSSQVPDSFAFEIQMMPDSLGEVSVRGYLSESTLKVNIATTGETVRNLIESEKEKLLERLNENAKVEASVDVRVKDVDGPSAAARPEGFQEVNASV